MPDTTETAHLGLPYLAAAQAQKHVTHNEALRLLDNVIQLSVLDRSLAEKRIFPAFDIAASGTRREEKLYRPDQLDAIYTLRRGLQQMPPQAAMEWMIKRIASTPNNDALLAGL